MSVSCRNETELYCRFINKERFTHDSTDAMSSADSPVLVRKLGAVRLSPVEIQETVWTHNHKEMSLFCANAAPTALDLISEVLKNDQTHQPSTAGVFAVAFRSLADCHAVRQRTAAGEQKSEIG
jgi:hypothetical protein